MSKVKYIVVHCSDSLWGTAQEINKWHVQRGWAEIGYHAVIMNGFPTSYHSKQDKREDIFDGMIEIGRELGPDNQLDKKEIGAHVKGINSESIGVCLIGVDRFTDKQILSLKKLIYHWMQKFNVEIINVRGHYEFDKSKTCPNINMVIFRGDLKKFIEEEKNPKKLTFTEKLQKAIKILAG